MTAAKDYYLIQTASSLTHQLIHDLMSRVEPCTDEWNELHDLANLAHELSDRAYAKAQAIEAPQTAPAAAEMYEPRGLHPAAADAQVAGAVWLTLDSPIEPF